MVRAGEDDPLDAGQGRGVKHVRQGIEVGSDHLRPRSKLVRVGRKVHNRIDAVEMGNPVIVQDTEVSFDDLRIIGVSGRIDQDQVVDIGPGDRAACGRYSRMHR